MMTTKKYSYPSYSDTERMNFLEKYPDQLENVRGRVNNEEVTVREACNFFMLLNLLWPCCSHGYYITPSHKCPWCFDGDVDSYQQIQGPGNGWLLRNEDKPCCDCGGPGGAGFGVISSSPKAAILQDTPRLCLRCTKLRWRISEG